MNQSQATSTEAGYYDQELRIALVMNGGVSLAVWIGGVTQEINRLVRGESLYGGLCDILHVRPRVDIISGTSAGGINGAILALAMSQGKPLEPLRDIWRDDGDILDLLRAATETDPPSLLRGAYFYEAMVRGFCRIRDQQGPGLQPPAQVPIELFLTTTVLRGEVRDFPDDAGAVIRDVTHRGRMHFFRGPDRSVDHFADGQIAHKLAAASRATASFPGAFEPFYLPGAAEKVKVSGEPVPSLDGHADFTLGCFVVDGGVLDNIPLEAAVDAVFRQRAEGEVRRVLAYVVPDPGQIPDPPSQDPAQIPTLASTILASLVEIPRVESVSEQLRAITSHNQQVARRYNTRLLVARSLGGAGAEEVAQSVFPGYRLRRRLSAADYIASALVEGAARHRDAADRPVALGRHSRERIAAALAQHAGAPWLPEGFGVAGREQAWWWGLLTLENVTAVVLELLCRAVALLPARRSAASDELWPALTAARRQAYDLVAELTALREQDHSYWLRHGTAIAAELQRVGERTDEELRAWAEGEIRGWVRSFDQSLGDAEPLRPPGVFAEQTAKLGELALLTAPLLHDVLALGVPQRSPEKYADLQTLVEFLLPVSVKDTDDVWRRMLALEVVHYAFGADTTRDQFMELYQFSANVPTAFGGPDRLQQKLAGVQAGHFGAFYKRSWRINDWMFGRLDGAERLLRVLLDPKRLARLYGQEDDAVAPQTAADRVLELLHGALLKDVERADDRALLESHWREAVGAMRRELAYLAKPDAAVPEQLPACAALLRERLHLEILRREVPALADAVGDDEAQGADPTAYGPLFLKRFHGALCQAPGAPVAFADLTTEQLVELFKGARVGEERLLNEVGTDRFTITATRSAAVAVGALSGKRSGLRYLRGIFAAARAPLVTVHVIVQALMKRGRVFTSLYVAAMAVGATILLAPKAEWPQGVESVAAIVLVAGLIFLLRRYPRVLIGLGVSAGAVAALAWLFAKACPLVQGWLG